MGISCVSSYRGAQLFETVGLDDDVVDLCFRGTINRISGTDFDDLQKDILETHEFAWDEKLKIKTGGLLKYVHDDEYHDYNPDVVKQLQECVSTGSYDDYKKFSEIIRKQTINLIEKQKFREYYSSKTGLGLGAKNFSWSAALYLDLKLNNT